ncbi:Uma2 family endonuclease [Actinocatenispora rupis]|uniref:Putative restriction endonuclease domain-containing protein n=1 Tax=Actinocatenispora rupis TaxID=519421 RepID=A0A8J3J6Y7_9ACTN|nr:hypothetical protein Aru02nite_21030 [Actinocatenispora rupis]
MGGDSGDGEVSLVGALPSHVPPFDGFTVEMAEHLLPEHARFELHGGRIVVMSPARVWHTEAQRRIANLLIRQGRIGRIEVGLAIAPGETRVLDVAAFVDEPDEDSAYFQPGEIELAVEVVSPSSRDDDYIDKPALYARLGIAEFWRADRDGSGTVHVAQFRLDPDRRVYVPAGVVPLDELDG